MRRLTAAVLFAFAVAVITLSAYLSSSEGIVSAYAIPYDAFRSLLRMGAAYLLSLLFAIVYGYAMFANRATERILQPLLDILQSVPILGFFPFAILLFVQLIPAKAVGWEVASIFLIFTSMAWNMTFGVYDSLRELPAELVDASNVYGLSGWKKFRTLLFPSMIPKLVYNSMLSWAGGWYFLIPAEYIITAQGGGAILPGIGSLLYFASGLGDIQLLLVGFFFLVGIIIVMDVSIWRPLSSWAEKYRYEYISEEGAGTSRNRNIFPFRSYFAWFPTMPRTRRRMTKSYEHAVNRLNRGGHAVAEFIRQTSRYWKAAGILAGITLAVLLALGVVEASFSIYAFFFTTGKEYATILPAALAYSLLRLVLAYLISVGIALPLAALAVRSGRLGRLVMPAAEVVASVPATAVFPIIVVALIGVTKGLNVPSILLLVTGMVWYVFFNVVAGLRSIPAELKEAAMNYGLRRWKYVRRVMLPAIFPSLMTGSITAFGGGWNALIVSEYVPSLTGGKPFYVLGLGYLIDKASYSSPQDMGLLVLSLVTMVVAVIAINRLFWRRMQSIAERKYKLEGVS